MERGIRACLLYTSEILAERLLERFPGASIVLTLGSKGSIYADREQKIHQKAYRVRAVDVYKRQVEDSLSGGVWMDSPDIGDLSVGESVTLAYQYTIPEGAADGEKIKNVAVAAGTTVPNPEDPEYPGEPEQPCLLYTSKRGCFLRIRLE